MRNRHYSICRYIAALAFVLSGCDGEPAVVSIDPTLAKTLPSELGAYLKEANAFIVVDPSGEVDYFRREYAILYVAGGQSIDAHLKEAGLEKAGPGPRGLGEPVALGERSKGQETEYNRRLSRLTAPSRDQWLAVRISKDRLSSIDADEILRNWATSLSGSVVSDEDGLRLLAFVVAHQAKYSNDGFVLNLDPVELPQGFLTSTTEGSLGPTSADPFSDGYWSLTNMDLAWQLAQVSKTRKPPGVWGASVNLAVVDQGFATATSELVSVYSVGFLGNADPDDNGQKWHGTKVSSVAAAPINDNIGGAGTAFHSKGSLGIDRLDLTGEVSLIWIRPSGMGKSDLAWGIEQAVLAFADVINYSAGGQCNGWCRAFAVFSGLSAQRSALEFAKEFDTPVIAAAGNDARDLDNEGQFLTPCELSGDLTVCVGSISRTGARSSFSNFGGNVDIFAPGNALQVGPTPDNASAQTFTGTSASAPFISGIVATAILLKGAAMTNTEIKNSVAITASTSSDNTVNGIVDAYRFLRPVAKILPDSFEPNNYEWQATVGMPVDALMTIHSPMNIGGADQDWFRIEAIPQCGSVEFDIQYLPDQTFGEPEVSTDRISWHQGQLVDNRTRHFSLNHIPIPWVDVGIRGSASGTTGYTIQNLTLSGNSYPAGEGPTYSASCDGVDNDCDGAIDEGFSDSDGDGIADCVDKDDDNDCVQDFSDNCPTTVNAHQFCTEANAPSASSPFSFSGCGDRSCNEPIDASDFNNFDNAIVECFRGVPIDPICFVDGCPFPGPMIYPEIQQTIMDSLDLINQIALSKRLTDPKWAKELKTVAQFEFKDTGEIRLPTMLEMEGLARAHSGKVARQMKSTDIPQCRALYRFGETFRKIIERNRRVQCWERIRSAACQVDTDGDGIGDACEQ